MARQGEPGIVLTTADWKNKGIAPGEATEEGGGFKRWSLLHSRKTTRQGMSIYLPDDVTSAVPRTCRGTFNHLPLLGRWLEPDSRLTRQRPLNTFFRTGTRQPQTHRFYL